MKKKYLLLLLIPILLIYLILGFNNELVITHYDYYNAKIPAEFNNYKILQISDLHCKNFGTEQSELISSIHACNPDIIVLTGDILDDNQTSVKPIYDLIAGLEQQYPIYFVTGNHELEPSASKSYGDMLDIFKSFNVVLLDNSKVTLEKNEHHIFLHGQKFRSKYVVNFLEPANTNQFNILLYHASDYFNLIAPYNYDLVLSGHIHGGVVRLPIIGGLLGADGSLFPKYDRGMHTFQSSTLIASAGLGDAAIPRFYNNPEIVLITLHYETSQNPE
ncbi:MAG: metallophosphoesterase [Lachnospiraceae bacterium]|nr:metallophosphoesterase [Lachnospiraceae bacterium]